MQKGRGLLFLLLMVWSIPLWSIVVSTDADLDRSPDSEPPIEEPAPVEWTPPNYADQDSALGYADYRFRIPPGLEDRVKFWTEIYTKHTSQGGVLHDSRYVHLVYKALDFSEVYSDLLLSAREKEKRIDKIIIEEKKKIEATLKKFQSSNSTFGFSEEEVKLWDMFQSVDEPLKFLEASRRGRLRFQAGQSDVFKNGIRQSGQFIRQMEQIFREEGMPVELTRMVWVESSFNLNARSKVGASGIWQFMRFTAKSYMRMDASVDERNDPLIATRAAARKLRGNYQMLEDWPLAVTGYNHGPYGIDRLSKKLKSKNIIDFVDFRKGSFGFASASFYASFLAALDVERRAGEIFGPLMLDAPVIGTEWRLKQALSINQLVDFFDGDQAKARRYNPHILSEVWSKKRMVLAKNMVRLDERALRKAQEWPRFNQFMFSTRAM